MGRMKRYYSEHPDEKLNAGFFWFFFFWFGQSHSYYDGSELHLGFL